MSNLTSLFSSPPMDIHSYVEPSFLGSLGRTAAEFGKQLLQPQVLVPALTAGAGYLMQGKALRDARKQAEELASASEAENRAITDRIQQMAQQRAAERVASMRNYAPIEADIEDSIRTTERAVTPSLPARAGKLPAEYYQALAQTETTEAARREQLRKLFARMLAPSQSAALQRLQDARFEDEATALQQGQAMLAGKNRRALAGVAPSGLQYGLGGMLGQAGAAWARNALMR